MFISFAPLPWGFFGGNRIRFQWCDEVLARSKTSAKILRFTVLKVDKKMKNVLDKQKLVIYEQNGL
jgi:hypothetical protein